MKDNRTQKNRGFVGRKKDAVFIPGINLFSSRCGTFGNLVLDKIDLARSKTKVFVVPRPIMLKVDQFIFKGENLKNFNSALTVMLVNRFPSYHNLVVSQILNLLRPNSVT